MAMFDFLEHRHYYRLYSQMVVSHNQNHLIALQVLK
jgi:hypothetical protein